MKTIKGLPTASELLTALGMMQMNETISVTNLTLAQEMYVDGMLSMYSVHTPCVLKISNTGRGKLISRIA